MKTQYLLDTNICIHLLHGKFGVKDRIVEVGVDNCYISDVTLAELYFGAYNSPEPERMLQGVRFITETFQILPISHSIIKRFGREKANLNKKGQLIDDFDILIGVTALEKDLIMVTENIKHLERLPIRIVNWVKR